MLSESEKRRREKWGNTEHLARGAAMLLIAFGILRIPYPKHDDSVAHGLLRILIRVSAFAVLPIVWNLWPIPGDQRFDGKRAAFLLGGIFISETVIRFEDDFFPQYPSSGAWIVSVMLASMGVIGILFWRHLKKSEDPSNPAKKVDPVQQ